MAPVNNPGLGTEYEVLLPAYLALKFFKNEKIKDFELRSNVKRFDKFDDVLIDIKMENGGQHHFAIQLKHKERRDGKLTPNSFHTGTDFNLEKYCEAYYKLASDDYECVICTNASFDPRKIKDIKKFTMALSGNDLVNNLLNSNIDNGYVYKFEINEETNNKGKFKKFFQHFFLCVAQKNTKELEKEIKNIFRAEYSSDDEKISTEYINLFRKWHKREFTNDILNRKALNIHLVDLLLGNFVIKRPNETINRNEKIRLLEESIRTFDVTVIEDSELKLINEMGKYEQENFLPSYIKELSKSYASHYKIVGNDMVHQCISRLAKEYKFIEKSQKELETHDEMKVFNYLLQKPFIINFNKDSKDKIFKVLEMNFKQDLNIKFVLLGKHIDQTQFGNLKVFKTLQDLRRYNKELYQKVIKETKITLQGREKIKLEDIIKISQEFESIIQVDHLCQDNARFGKELEELPEYYIPRTVSTFILKEEKVLKELVTKKSVFVVDYGTEYQYIEEIAVRESLEIISIDEFIEKLINTKKGSIEHKCLVVTKDMYIKQQFDEICSMIDNNVCFIKINKQRQFILIKTKNDEVNGKFLEETESISNFCYGINVLCAEPGMGKTSSMKNFRNNCPSDQWAVFLELRQFGSLFEQYNLESGEILERLLCEDNEDMIVKNLRNIFIRNRKISLYLDGLDELDNKCIDNVLLFIKKLQEDGFSAWLSSRNSLKDKIEAELNIFSIDLNQVQREQQREYINNRLRSHNYSEDQTNKIINKIFYSTYIQNNSNILGIPLQLFMVTQIFIDDKNKYAEISEKQFILTKLYSNYFKGKIKHAFQKEGKVKNESNFKRNAKIILEQYEISGLRSCLNDDDFKNLNLRENKIIKYEKFISNIKKNGDSYGIIKNVNEAKTVTFVHHTHAEYFAAIYLSENFDKVQILGEGFLMKKYDNLRLLFDIKLAENSPLHLSVLYNDLNQFNEHIVNRDNSNIRDKGGRKALHLVCTYGTRYSNLEYKKEGNKFYYDISSNIKEEKKSVVTMTDKLVKLCRSMTEDEIFKWNEFQYASKSWCIYPLQAILKEQQDLGKFLSPKETRSFLKSRFLRKSLFIEGMKKFLNNNDKGAIAYYAAKFGYKDLMEALFGGSNFSINKMKYDQKQYTLLHTACIEGHKEVALLLINKKSQINAVDLYGDTPLHYASLRGDHEIVNLLIQNKVKVNAANKYSYTSLNYAYEKGHQETVRLLIQNNAKEDNNNVLHDACKKGHYQIVYFFVANNADVNSVDEYGNTPLHWACRNGHKDTALLLIQNNANVNSVNIYGDTSLHLACINGHKDIAALLIQRNASVNNSGRYGDTPLHYTCLSGHKETINLLIENKANVNACNKYGYTPLNYAYVKAHREIVRLLIENNARADNTNVLHDACKKGHYQIVLFLVRNGVDVNSDDADGRTPLHWACMNGHNKIELLLIRNNAFVNIVDEYGDTPLHLALRNEHKEITFSLIQNNANINIADRYGRTPLHEACVNGHQEITLFLIRNNAKVNSVDRYGDTSLHLVLRNKHNEIALLLIRNNANPNSIDRYGDTPLHLALRNGYKKIALLLIQNNANVNIVNKYGCTPLHEACVNGHKKNVILLIQNNANVNSVDGDGYKPLHLALRNGHNEIALLLIENNANINSVDKYGATPLRLALWNGHKEIALLLIQKNLNVNSVNKNGETPLQLAPSFVRKVITAPFKKNTYK